MAERSAEYWKRYRQRNAARINAQQRERYAARKEVVAPSAKTEQQPASHFGKASRASVRHRQVVVPLFPEDGNEAQPLERAAAKASSPGKCLGSSVARSSRNQGEQVVALRSRRVAAEPVSTTKHLTTTAGDLAVENGTQLATAQIEDTSISERVAQHVMAQPGRWIGCAVLIAFLACNTAYLAIEQRDMYSLLGYSAGLALGIALLCEAAIEIQAFFWASLAWGWQTWPWKLALSASLAASLWMVSGMVSDAGEEKAKAMLSEIKPPSLKATEVRVNMLAAQLERATAALSNYDPKNERTKLLYATDSLNRRGGLPDQLTAANLALKSEEQVFKASKEYQNLLKRAGRQGDQRRLALVWNVLLAQLLAFLLRRPTVMCGARGGPA